MKDSTDNTLNGGGIVPEHHDGPLVIVIHPIRRSITYRKSTDTKVHTITLGPKVFLTPHNGLLNDGPNLLDTKI
jgi:hypothetical protein